MKPRSNQITGPSINRHNSKQDYSTPKTFIDAVVARFGPIHFDLAANKQNTKAASYYSAADDALKQIWWTHNGTLWLNPPFGDIEPWACKCLATHAAPKFKGKILFLVPNSTGAQWFARYVFEECRVLFLSPRMSFDGKGPYPKDLLLCVYDSQFKPGFELWRWK